MAIQGSIFDAKAKEKSREGQRSMLFGTGTKVNDGEVLGAISPNSKEWDIAVAAVFFFDVCV